MVYFINSSTLNRLPVLGRLPHFIFLFAALTLILTACNNPPVSTHSSLDYKKVLDSANRMYDADKYEPAKHYLDSATSQYKNLGVQQRFDYYGFNCNYYFNLKKDNSKAMPYADSMLNLFNSPEKKIKYMSDYGLALFSKGDVLFGEKKYNEAYRYFYQGKLVAKKDINKCTLSDYSYRMGMIMYQQEHFKLAAENFKSSLREVGACSLTFRSFYRRQELMDNLGLSYSKINEPDSAMIYYAMGLDYINKQGRKFNLRNQSLDIARAVIYGNQADIYINENKFQIAKKLLKKSAEINLRKGNDNRDGLFTQLKLAHIYYQINELDSLVNLLKAVRPRLDSVKDDDIEADWNFMMANYFNKKDNPKAALNYFTRYDALKDTILSKNKALKEADITQQIVRLEKENEFNTLKKNSEQQNTYLKLAAVFGVMLLIIFLLILLNWQKSRRNIKVLGQLNHQINEQNHSLESALEEIKSSSQEKDRILRAVAHDLRNPIGGIAALTQAMGDEDFTDDQKGLINLIKETSNNSLELINEILEVANNGSAVLNKELVDINSVLSHSIELMRFKAAEKAQEIELRLLEKPVELMISREKIWRVISNLISNAIKFSPPGSSIYVQITDNADSVDISVKDTGIGIPEKIKSKVFNIFTEAKRSGTAGEKSFGLGLSISRQIVEKHGGKIWFESSAEKGTIFYVRLPKGS